MDDMIKPVRQLYAIVILNCVASTFAGEISYNSQSRFTRIEFGSVCGNLSEQEDAIGFDPFDSVLSRDFQLGDSMIVCSGFAEAIQNSRLTPTSLIANGSASGTTGPPTGTNGAGGQSYFEVGFSIDEPSEYTLDLSVAEVYMGEVRFLGPSFSIDTPVGILPGSNGTAPMNWQSRNLESSSRVVTRWLSM